MSVFEAWHLPGLEPDHVEEWRERVLPDGVRLRWPWLRAGAMRELAGRVAAAREALDGVPVVEIIGAVNRVAARLVDPADPLRAEAAALLPAVTGFHPAMVTLVLDRMAAEWRTPALERLLQAELGGAAALDGFVALPGGRRARAFGPRLALHVFAGNVPGVAVTSLIRVLLVRGASVGKTAAGEPVLPVLFARALATEHAALGDALAVTYWPGGEGPAEQEALAAADVAVGYGNAAAMAALRRAAPPGARLVEHGPRVSVGIVGPGALTDPARAETVAREAARAIAVVDQQGCVSPQALLVVDGCPVTPLAFTRALAAAFEQLEETLPRGGLEPGEAAAVHRLRNEAEFRAIAGAPVEIFAAPGTAWTVVLDATGELRASCLNRFVTVHPVASVRAAVVRLTPLAAALQTVAVAGAEELEAAAAALGRLGATRVTSFRAAPWPPGHGLHDGRGPLRELVRWTELEDGS
ncbi:MAG: acyl-CoA reductase [Gemmatimonadota bacterium]